MPEEELIALIQDNGRHNGYEISFGQAQATIQALRVAAQHGAEWPLTLGTLFAFAGRLVFGTAEAELP